MNDEKTYDPTKATLADLPKPSPYPEGRYLWTVKDYEQGQWPAGDEFVEVTLAPVQGYALDQQDTTNCGWYEQKARFNCTRQGLYGLHKFVCLMRPEWKDVEAETLPPFTQQIEAIIGQQVVGQLQHKPKGEGKEGFWTNFNQKGWESADGHTPPL